ncbi:hypothetical protein BH24ACI3_BH24ACI3_12750 [soil metagenome]
MSIEIEKKYRLPSARRSEVEDTLKEFGAEYLGEDIEENTIFGGPALAEKGAILRIRRIGERTILTYKRRLAGEGGAKHQIEEETEVADAVSIRNIVEALGLVAGVVYEKRRNTWKFRNTEVVIDELPFGLYMEIEGSITSIKETEMLLDIEDLEVEHLTYPRLTMQHGELNGAVSEARF